MYLSIELYTESISVSTMQEYLSIFLWLYEDRRRQKHRSRFLATKKDIHTLVKNS